MKILVNDKNINYSLESEKNLGEVIKDMKKWINKNDNVIRGMKVNRKDFSLDGIVGNNNIDISSVDTLEIVTINKIDLAFDTLETLNEYSNSLLNKCNGNIIEKNDEIMEGIELITEGVQLSLRILDINPAVIINNLDNKLENAIGKLKEMKEEYERKYLDDRAVHELKEILSNMNEFVIKIYKWGVIKNYGKIKNEGLKEIPFIPEVLNDFILVCENMENKFEEVGTCLQTGNDIKAFTEIYQLSDIINEIIEILIVVNNIVVKKNRDILKNLKTEKLFEKITSNLKEVENAFHNEDMVTIADIMEYELKPLFKELIEIINKINDLVKNS